MRDFDFEKQKTGTTLLFVALFVCGISGISVLLSFIQISSIEPKKLLRSM